MNARKAKAFIPVCGGQLAGVEPDLPDSKIFL